MSLIMVMLNPWLAEELSFSKVLTLCMIPVATYSIINSIFIQIYQPLLRSKKGCDSIFCAKLSGFLSIGDIYVMYGN